MKFKFLLFTIVFILIESYVSGQSAELIHPPSFHSSRFVNHKKMAVQNEHPPVWLDPKTNVLEKKWDVALTQRGVNHGSDIPKTWMDSIKQEGRRLMQYRDSIYRDSLYDGEVAGSGRPHMAITPYVNMSFKGNQFDFWSPPDNNLAVSDDGYLVSVINASVMCADVAGNIILEESFDDYFSILGLNGGYFDPKVLYDPDEDKFILVVLNGNTPATSTIVIGFSRTSNPNDGWWLYTFSGDPAGYNLWFDYPSIGISTDDLYISGNQYTGGNQFNQVMIYQMGKGSGFKGENVHSVHYSDVRDAHGFSDFTVVPLSYGFDGSVGPGIYLISTDGSGGTEATLYYTDNNAENNPNLYAYSVPITNYYTPFNGLMLGTTDALNTSDCRTLTGFYADGAVHFAFNTRGDDFHTKVYYCRVNTNDLTNTSVRIGLQPYEYAYPCIAPFSDSETDKSVLVGFLRTSSTIYPEFRMIAVDHDMNYDNSHIVKSGKSYVNSAAGTTERWGDYSGISRRHSADGPEVWISGCYGEENENGHSDILCTWIAQVTDEQADEQLPVADFTSDITNVSHGDTVKFLDLTTNNPNKWQWFFPGGTPSLSGEQNPVIVYTEPGCHNVTLNAYNAAGIDAITKPCYIDVLTAVTETDTLFNQFIIFPNPVSNGRLNVEFETYHAAELDFLIADEHGHMLKNLLHRVVKAGMNNLSFNIDPLSPGPYYLVVQNEKSLVIKSEKIMVIR